MEISNCCGAPINNKRCRDCKDICETETVCQDCGGTGEVPCDAPVYAGEPHMASIGTESCHCKEYAYA